MRSPRSAKVLAEPPDPSRAHTLDELIALLRLLKLWAGDPSYEAITERINDAWGRAGRPASELARKSTVADCFKAGRRRPAEDLLLAVVNAMHPDVGYLAQWRQALKIARGEAAAATFVRAQDRLPDDIVEFAGRDEQLARLIAGNEGVSTMIAAIDGMAGVGKTRLAVRAGHILLRQRHFDRVLFVNLRGFHGDPAQPPADPAAVLDTFLRLLDVPGQQIPHKLSLRIDLYQQQLRDKRALVVLDNAADAEQVWPLLPDGGDCAVIVTSRHTLSDLPGNSVHLTLDVFTPDEALEVIRAAAGQERFAASPEVANVIAGLLGCLPLAISLVAERIKADSTWSLDDHLERLLEHDDTPRTGTAAVGASGRNVPQDRATLARSIRLERGVELSLWLSYDGLTPPLRQTFRLLALHPGGDFDVHAVAALTSTDLETAQQHVDQLLAANLLQQRTPDRYEFHDLVRAYAVRRAQDEDPRRERHQAHERLLDHYVWTAARAMDLCIPHEADRRPHLTDPGTPIPALPDPRTAMTWLDTERANLVAAALHAAELDMGAHISHLSVILSRYLDNGGHHDDAERLHTLALGHGDPDKKKEALRFLGIVCWRMARFDEAYNHFREALTLARETNDRNSEGFALGNLGNVLVQLHRYEEALDHYHRAGAAFHEVGDRGSEGRTLGNVGAIYESLGRYQDALDSRQQALATLREVGDRIGEGIELSNVGTILMRMGRYDEALHCHEQTLALVRDGANRAHEGHVLRDLGVTHTQLGNYEKALGYYREALDLVRDTADPSGESSVLSNLGVTYARLERFDDALQCQLRALDIAVEVDDRELQADVLNGLGDTMLSTGSPAEAVDHHCRALALSQDIGDRFQQARAHNGIACALATDGNSKTARMHWEQALQIYDQFSLPEAGLVQARLAAIHDEWPDG